MNIIMLGAPGAGKGTQAKLISKQLNIPHISTGDIFRLNIKNKTEIGIEAKKYIDQGLLVPDILVINLVLDRLKSDDCKNGYVLDGFPRTFPQAEALNDYLNTFNKNINYVINIQVPDENIITRMAGRRVCLNCGAIYHMKSNLPKKENICDVCDKPLILREDDKEKTVLKRLTIYHKQTQPLIEYYYHKKLLVNVDGTKSLKNVTDEIRKILGA